MKSSRRTESGEEFLSSRDFRFRLFIVLLLLLAFFSIILARLFQLQVIDYADLSARCDAQYARNITISAHRGNIYDSHGQLLVTDLEVESAYLAPEALKTPEEKTALSENLATILKMPAEQILSDLNRKTFFLWLKRKLTDKEADSIRALKSPGVGLVKEPKRIYLKDAFLANVLGMTGLDNQGLSGLEFKYERILRGEPGRLISDMDPAGNPLLNRDTSFTAPQEGKEIVLTVDEFIQYHTEKALREAVEKHAAAGGVIIVMNPENGEIISLASQPTFDPNDFDVSSPERRRNRAVSWSYEPGSTFKVVTAAAALNEGVVTPETTFYCPREFVIGGRRIKEAHDAISNSGMKSVTEIITDSLNIGAAQIGLKLGPEKMSRYIKDFGFGLPTGVDLPGEERGIVRNYKKWAECDAGIIPFGQGISVTPLQLITAVAAIANGGYLVQPYLARTIKSLDGNYIHNIQPAVKKRVISAEAAEKVKLMMENVVQKGTGKCVQTAGYRVAGKTGTGQKTIPGGLGYWSGHYVGSFVGFFPLEKPRVIILVLIDDPGANGYYGGVVAAPAFKKLADEIIPYLKIPPDAPLPEIPVRT